MKEFIVTIKLPRNPDHNPRNKMEGICPVSGARCTDVTGEHHSYIQEGESVEEVVAEFREKHPKVHVTRIEGV